jgi:hypothetical protein
VFELKRYTSNLKYSWDEFIHSSKNGTFLFSRDYMDYHSDRYKDNSFLIYNNKKIIAVLPGNISYDKFYSHQGLTYGGFVLSERVGVTNVLSFFSLINSALKEEGVTEVIYKPVPYIYHKIPSQEDIYYMFKLGANKIGCHVSSAISNSRKLIFKESRKCGIRKSKRANIKICLAERFDEFWELLSNNLQKIYKINPVHSLEEIKYLKNQFPGNIKLHVAEYNEEVVAGTVIYQTSRVAHVQYISASETGRRLGALDMLFNELINYIYSDMPFFDFGSSTEQMGNYLNEKLIFQKEGFGGRGVVYETYQYSL